MRQPKPIRDTAPHENGQGTLELALCLPLFLLFILGTVEIANIAWAAVQLNNAAHAGAQFGSQSRGNAADPTDIEAAARSEAPKLTITFPAAPQQVCSCVDSTGSPVSGRGCTTLDPTTGCPSPYIILDSIQVTTQAAVRPLIHYPGLPASYTLNAQATMGVVK